LTPKERSDAVRALPACIDHNRLCKLQDPFYARMDALIQQMLPFRRAQQKGAPPRLQCYLVAGALTAGEGLDAGSETSGRQGATLPVNLHEDERQKRVWPYDAAADAVHSRTSYSNATPSGSFSCSDVSAASSLGRILEMIDVANFLA
jgi:hypothetical protein